jgi:hypothetical protein
LTSDSKRQINSWLVLPRRIGARSNYNFDSTVGLATVTAIPEPFDMGAHDIGLCKRWFHGLPKAEQADVPISLKNQLALGINQLRPVALRRLAKRGIRLGCPNLRLDCHTSIQTCV